MEFPMKRSKTLARPNDDGSLIKSDPMILSGGSAGDDLAI